MANKKAVPKGQPVVKVSQPVFRQYIDLLENLTIAVEHQDPTEVEKAAIPARIFLDTVRNQTALINLVVV